MSETQRPSPVLLAASLLAFVLAAVALTVLGGWGEGAPGGDAAGAAPEPAAQAASGGGPVVLELFTSQGCSSCPPADRLLSELAADPQLGDRVLPLSFHVDYWNYIGWRDPFSSGRWSERQRDYARAFEDGRVYTPMTVVDGRRHMVGSRQRQVRGAVREALQRVPAAQVTVEPGAVGEGRVEVSVRAELERVPEGGGPLVGWVALWQDDLVTPVSRGENADRTLENDRVVRSLVRAFELPARSGAEAAGRVELELDPGWPRDDLGVVAFVQHPRTRAIHGAAGTRLGG